MYDAIVIGAGHNGLTAAAYLARAGLRTVVLERREQIGGATVTEELWPGYRISRASYVAGLLRPVVLRELGLAGHGLRLLPRNPASFTPLPDGCSLLLGSDTDASCASIARFSKRDAERYPRYEAMLESAARLIETLLDVAPPDPAAPAWRDLAPLSRAFLRAVSLRRELPRAAQLLLGAARPAVEGWFESEPLRGTLATDAIIGAWAAPSSPGTGYVLLHHVMGETGGARGVWAYVAGGMGGLADALAGAARAAGAEVRVGATVASISVAGARAVGVVLEDGSEVAAPLVLSSADPDRTFRRMLDPALLPDDFRDDLATLDYRSPVAKINLALDRLPSFRGHTADGVAGPEHRGTIHLGARELDELDASFAAAERGSIPERPMIELTIPSVLDPSLAPEGHHTASMFVQHLPLGVPVDRDALAWQVFRLVDEVALGFSSSVLHHEVLLAEDLERIFGLTGGNIFHGAMSLDRLLFMRPVAGWARYRTPVDGLWLCGAGTHPGGGVMGACGRNAAREVLRAHAPRR